MLLTKFLLNIVLFNQTIYQNKIGVIKIKSLSTFVVLALMLLTNVGTAVLAQDSTASDTTYRNRVLFLPAVGASPETGFLFGAVAVPQFKVAHAGPETRSSSILISGIYTLKNQILTSFVPDIIFPLEKWILSGNYFVNYYPENYWGVGPSTRKGDKLNVLYTQVNFEQTVLRQIKPGLFVGPYLRWSKLYHVKFENSDGDRVPAPDVRGNDGSTSAGIGFTIRWDERNSNMTPIRNHFMEFSLLANPSFPGSSDPYTSYQLDARKYFDLGKNQNSVFALQGLFRFTTGHPPFRDMSLIGGDMINRGYYEGRFRDQNAGQVQVELRQHMFGRFGLTLFAASGQVWDRFSELTFANYKWTTGAGLRFDVNPQDPTNLRIDFGLGRNTSGFYLQFGEAF